MAGEKTVAIKLIKQLRADAREQDLHCILLAAQNRSQFGAVSFAEERFGKMARMLLDVVAQNFVGGICRLSKSARQFPAGFFLLQQTVPNETGHQPLKGGSHCRRHPECRRIK